VNKNIITVDLIKKLVQALNDISDENKHLTVLELRTIQLAGVMFLFTTFSCDFIDDKNKFFEVIDKIIKEYINKKK